MEGEKRRLAAIMFTDIAGYTKLMGESEARANEIRKRHRDVFERFHERYRGRVVQYFGDGTLSTFESCVDAVRCAIDMQVAFRETPPVPLRIGIHLGDIVLSEQDVFGQGVNVASRIESLGVPGSVLISSDVRKQIRNHGIGTISMGHFPLKNVETAPEIFAVESAGLTVPTSSDLQGKAIRVKPQPSKSTLRFGGKTALLSAAFIGLCAALLWWLGTSQNEDAHLLPESIREEKVAVNIFENFTRDQNLDAVGFLASEWITSGLRELSIKTVAPEMIRQYKDYVGILPNNPEGRTSFAEITNAQYVISGSYFAQGDTIRLITRLLSTLTGDEVQKFPIIFALREDKESLIERARQLLMGYWALEQNQHFPKVNPPSYDAYQKFLECRPGYLHCYLDVLKLDSTFLLAHVSLMNSAVWWNQDSVFNASESFVRENWEKCTEYEKNYYHHSVAFKEGDFQRAFDFYDANYQMDTMNLIMLHETGYFAASHINRPDIAIERYRKLFKNYEVFRPHAWNNNYYHYADALNRTGQPEKVIEFVRQLPAGDWKDKAGNWSWFELYRAYLLTGQNDRAIQYVDTLFNWQPWVPHLSRASYIWSTIHQDTLLNPFHDRIRNRINEFSDGPDQSAWVLQSIYTAGAPFALRAYQYYLLDDLPEAEKQIRQMQADPPKFLQPGQEALESPNEGVFDAWTEGILGCIYAREGKKALALQQLEQLEQLKLIKPTFHSKINPTLRGFIPYLQARIHALLNDKESAVRLLKQSLHEGKATLWMSFEVDYDLTGLRGYPPYEELLKPGVKNVPQ